VKSNVHAFSSEQARLRRQREPVLIHEFATMELAVVETT
jgi:hypothetical protein